MLAAKKRKVEKKPSDQHGSKSHQKDIEALTKGQIETIRSMESQKPAGKMVSSLLDF
jgi:hypothetical protein